MPSRTATLVPLLLVVTGTACSSGPPADLRANAPSVRIPAIQRAVRERDLSSARQLVRDLRSDDAAIRLYAIEGLERLTGQNLGYRYYDDPLPRHEAAKQWEAWLKDQEAPSKPEG